MLSALARQASRVNRRVAQRRTCQWPALCAPCRVVPTAQVCKVCVAQCSAAAGAIHDLSPLLSLPCAQVCEVCVLVVLRSARMVAMALDGLLTHSGWKERTAAALAERRAAAAAASPSGASNPVFAADACCAELGATIAVDGGVYEKLPGYSRMLDTALRELLGGWCCRRAVRRGALRAQARAAHVGLVCAHTAVPHCCALACCLLHAGPDLHPLVQVKLTKDGSSLGAVVLAAAAAAQEGSASNNSAPASPAPAPRPWH